MYSWRGWGWRCSWVPFCACHKAEVSVTPVVLQDHPMDEWITCPPLVILWVLKSAENWLVVWLPWILFSHFCWECHHPNWRTHIFQRGGPGPPTRKSVVENHRFKPRQDHKWMVWWFFEGSVGGFLTGVQALKDISPEKPSEFGWTKLCRISDVVKSAEWFACCLPEPKLGEWRAAGVTEPPRNR